MGLTRLRQLGDLLNLSFAKQGCGSHRAHPKRFRRDNLNADRLRQPLRFLDPGLGRSSRTFAGKLGNGDDRALAARDVYRAIAVERVQDSTSGSPSLSAPSFNGCSGWSVEIACL